MSNADTATYPPFLLITGKYESLILSDKDMAARLSVFEERADEGWLGNGYDWTSIAKVLLDEKLSDIQGDVAFDPEAGMFSAHGPLAALKRLGQEMKQVFDNETILRDMLSRAELD